MTMERVERWVSHPHQCTIKPIIEGGKRGARADTQHTHTSRKGGMHLNLGDTGYLSSRMDAGARRHYLRSNYSQWRQAIGPQRLS